MNEKCAIAICDDHPLIREGLERMLLANGNYNVVASASDGDELWAQLKISAPQIVILDLQLGETNGTAICKRIKDAFPLISIVGFSMILDPLVLAEFIKAGGQSFVSKQSSTDELIKALDKTREGENYIDPYVAASLARALNQSNATSLRPRLSMREREVLQLILDEFTTAEIASKLSISVDTVETHRRNLLQKTGAKNLAGLVRIALEEKLLD